MHFWIDKRNQGCGFNVRRQVPPSLSGYGRNQRNLCGTYYPKPMVTPVHRFQSLEGVTHSGYRYARAPGYHARHPPPPSVHYNGSRQRPDGTDGQIAGNDSARKHAHHEEQQLPDVVS
ncbi:hypothetical protein NQ318_022328 [Aromia moschata]|uniref:Uncharacterized protein n=1 Tax=Aromia moschata TaxID=1265417 RepID=A0AAV8Z6N9_9CUCU|nr:hypothetical protein NQ318_022328 [Aromia moschata]